MRSCGMVLLACLCAATAAGCGSSQAAGPDTVPLSGKVVFAKGGKSVASLNSRSAKVELLSIDHPNVRAYGAIEEDGSFTMATRFEESGKPGVVPGKHRVRLGLDDNAAHLVAPKFLSFEQSGITVTAPSEQPVEIKVW